MSDEIVLRLTRDDADLIRRLRRDGICSDVEGLIERLDGALAVDPAPDDLETAIRECEANGWLWKIDCLTRNPITYAAGVVGHDLRCQWCDGDTPLAALRQAMARARGTEGAE